MSEPRVHPQPKVPGGAKALLCLLGVIILAVGLYALMMTARQPSVEVAPPASGLVEGSR